jgi:hypothetical protein
VNSSGPSGPANHVHEGLTAADLWTLGASELVAAQARERERKLDVCKQCTCLVISVDYFVASVTALYVISVTIFSHYKHTGRKIS